MNDEEYEEMVNRSGMVDLMRRGKADSNFQRWLIDDQEEVSYLQNALRGLMFNRELNTFEEVEGTRLMNDKGARILTETYILFVAKNGKMSNLDEEEINNLLYDNMRSITDHLYMNLENYEIDFKDLGLILNIIKSYLKTVLNRGLGGGEQERLGTTQKVISEERITNNQNQAGNMYEQQPEMYGAPTKSGFLNKLFP